MTDELAQQLSEARRSLLSAVEGLTQERAVLRPNTDEWSVLEVLAHLVDTDYHYLTEARAMRDEKDHMLLHFDDEAWKRDHVNIRDTPFAAIMYSLTLSHAEVVAQAAEMTESELSRPGRHPRGIPYTVHDVFLRLPPHDQNHEQQIRDILTRV